LLSAGERLKALGSLITNADSHLRGIEIHKTSAIAAEKALAAAGFNCDIQTLDFFDVSPKPLCDAVLGNPPYVRYQQFSGSARAKGLEAALAHGVRLSLLASSWAPFVVHAAQFLKPDGRLGLVLPAELLSVKYAAEVRRFLLNRFASVKLVMFEELVFPDVLEEVVLLLAEGTGPTPGFELYQARNVAELESPNGSAWTQFTPQSTEKWTSALLRSEALDIYQNLAASDGTNTLLDWGETYLGAVTGNNKYFALTEKHAIDLGLGQKELLPISPPGSRHLRGITLTEKAWSELVAGGSCCYLFYPKTERQSAAADRYIKAGETMGVPKAYKCQARKPWWRVPLVPMADLLLTYMDYTCPRLITNEAKLYHLNSLYGVRLKEDRRKLGRDLLPISSLNTLTLLGAEMVGRSYGGGILKLEPKEADQLPLPSDLILQNAAAELQTLRPQLSIALRQGDISRVVKAVDGILLKKHLGLKLSELRILREARESLFSRRIGRGKRTHGAN